MLAGIETRRACAGLLLLVAAPMLRVRESVNRADQSRLDQIGNLEFLQELSSHFRNKGPSRFTSGLMHHFAIRDAGRADLAGLIGLEEEVFASDRLSARSFRRLIASPSAACRIAESEGALAGYALLLLRRGGTAARLYSIAVAPAFRGQGVAALLMADAEDLARKRGARALRLEARVDNAGAIRLYHRLGYGVIGRRPGYYADGADAVRFERRLDDSGKNRATSAEEDRSPRDSDATIAYMSRPVRPEFAVAAPAEARADQFRPRQR